MQNCVNYDLNYQTSLACHNYQSFRETRLALIIVDLDWLLFSPSMGQAKALELNSYYHTDTLNMTWDFPICI